MQAAHNRKSERKTLYVSRFGFSIFKQLIVFHSSASNLYSPERERQKGKQRVHARNKSIFDMLAIRQLSNNFFLLSIAPFVFLYTSFFPLVYLLISDIFIGSNAVHAIDKKKRFEK